MTLLQTRLLQQYLKGEDVPIERQCSIFNDTLSVELCHACCIRELRWLNSTETVSIPHKD